ncbi:UDP-N-acetylmuramate dehydrogenase [Blattabacterium cuenoti]|uniref:UDP-N-acetylmuramate dehydrogenase n=1 Tax=Blattabacterium cuenoti TaxID=1653831 RepID=UPI00163CCD92|nr:UDP-N-acetylmuramate dehydrogenase [Blattabacterium cuenoti]
MIIQQNFSLQKFNTFGVEIYTRYYVEVKNLYEVKKVFTMFPYIPKFILGNGSNLLFLNNYYPGVVIRVKIKGKKIIEENRDQGIVQAFAGENWSHFVMWTVDNGFYGLENLFGIPGTVGASPIQNIGAYGTEIQDCLFKVQVYQINHGNIIECYREQCNFQYRSSIFKNHNYNNQFFILSVFFVLKKNKKMNISYVGIRKELQNMHITNPNRYDLMQAIMNIRSQKLPDPITMGNVGSFFMNPIVEIMFFEKLKLKYPMIIGNLLGEKKVKISASSLIEHIGWKGKRMRNVGVYEKLPIVLVNYGGASGREIYFFSKQIINQVKKTFHIAFLREVHLIR